MAIVKCKPTSPGRRFVEKVVHSHLHKVNKKLAVVTVLVVSLLVISVVDTSNFTV